MKKLAYRIRTKNYLLDNNTRHQEDYIPQLNVKLKNWNPPPAPLITEERMTYLKKDFLKPLDLTPVKNTTSLVLLHLKSKRSMNSKILKNSLSSLRTRT